MVKITIKAARVNAGLTQKEAAKRLGISNSTLGNWENGQTMPDIKQVEKLCEMYGVTYDALNFLPNDSL